ncbi:MAG: N-acetylmuramic acid 6-phosphate etherase [Verrucomicrobia bacterium]|nr:N-acetylmuramic acid 6-phosphate etherase [Verrucomicrobiota bacterium]
MSIAKQPTVPSFLGIECGGTKSVAVFTQSSGTQAVQIEAGPANLRLLNDPQLVAHFRKISAIHPAKSPPVAIAIGMAGARTEMDRDRIRTAAAKVWPGASCHATNDLETALVAAEITDERELARILVLSGTGSCCYGQTPAGKTAKVGGWGHFIGDKGSGYEIGLRALKAVVYYYDRDGVWPKLGQKLLRSLQLNEPNDLIGWVQGANKTDIAALAVEVFSAWNKGEKIADDIITAAAESLANDAVDCAKRLVKVGTPVQFILAGSTLLKQPKFAGAVGDRVQKLWAKSVVAPLNRESVWGAVELARKAYDQSNQASTVLGVSTESLFGPSFLSPELPATERRNPHSVNLDQLSIEEMVSLMLNEDEKVPAAIANEREKIAKAVRMITAAFKKGGRLFYIGAGTSGRLGVLDASECPPTFRTSPEMVQGIIAGGQSALWKAVEGAEDDSIAGAEAIRFNNITAKDVVVGIAASGKTPYVWGALMEARKRKAGSMLICFNPHLKIATKHKPDIFIAPDIGPEVLTGSTRLKAGTATKLILNMLTTLSMVKLGKVISNLMVDLNPSNIKLRDRAVRIVCDVTGVDPATAHKELEEAGWTVKAVCLKLRKSQPKRKSSSGEKLPLISRKSSTIASSGLCA